MFPHGINEGTAQIFVPRSGGMKNLDQTRRRFMSTFAAISLGTTLVPGVLWARMQDAGAQKITLPMVTEALELAGIEMTEDEKADWSNAANRNLDAATMICTSSTSRTMCRRRSISARVAGHDGQQDEAAIQLSAAPTVKRPANLEDVAFWPVRHLAELVKTRQVTSLELTEMYLARLHRYNPRSTTSSRSSMTTAAPKRSVPTPKSPRANTKARCTAFRGARRTSSRSRASRRRGARQRSRIRCWITTPPLSSMLREAGAVLIAKVATGELAGGDNWFGGQTKSPWDPTQGSSGSSAGPSSATAAGCVAFGIGTETSGSILCPSARCGLAGLRPTFGRVSRYGVMALSWTQDRLGPIVRYAEDAAIVMQAIARPDGRDMSVSDVPFNWNARFNVKKLKVGYHQGIVR